MNVALVARCGGDYGWGHWIRCLNLAAAARAMRRGWSVAALYDGPDRAVGIAEGYLKSLEGIAVRPLGEMGCPLSFDAVLIDRLEHSAADLLFWKSRCERLAVFDDMGEVASGADLVIRPQLLPDGGRPLTEGRLLYGPRYFPVAPGWIRLREQYRLDPADRLVVCLGGGTTNRRGYELTAEALAACRDVEQDKITFVLGYELHEGELPARIRSALGAVEILPSVDLPALMRTARLAVVAGGFVKYDLAVAGVPAVILSGPDHQAILARAFAQAGAGVYAGSIDDLAPQQLATAILQTWSDDQRLVDVSHSAKTLSDGCGSERVLAALEETTGQSLGALE